MCYQDKIISFNADKDVIRLREKYNEPTFFEIISKERSETTYSSFLKWIFQESVSLANEANPLMLLLDVLVKNDKDDVIDGKLKESILTRTLQIKSLESEVEKSVASLSCEAKRLVNQTIQNNKGDFEKNCKDKVDVFIRCDIEENKKAKGELQVIIENKIDSQEGPLKGKEKTGIDDYDNSKQTTRYYLGTKRDDPNVFQIYVYLTPAEQKEGPDEKNFIHISYQDLFDGVVIPLMASSSLSSRSRFFLEEFRNQLTYPRLTDKSINQCLALGDDQSSVFNELWDKYNELIVNSILSLNQTVFWEYEKKWFMNFPKEQLAEEIVKKKTDFKKKFYNGDSFRKKISLVKVTNFANDLQISIPKEKKCPENEHNLLTSFWEHNKRLLMALLSGLKKDSIENRRELLLAELSKRDTTKYTIKYEGVIIGEHLGKRATVLKAFENIINNGRDLPSKKMNKRIIYYKKEEFKNAYEKGEITDDTYRNRYSQVGDYYVSNQWGIGNWGEAEKLFEQSGFILIAE